MNTIELTTPEAAREFAHNMQPGQPVVIVVDSSKEAKRLESELQSIKKERCGYSPNPAKEECWYCAHSGRYQGSSYQNHYWCGLHGFTCAARGKCNDFRRTR